MKVILKVGWNPILELVGSVSIKWYNSWLKVKTGYREAVILRRRGQWLEKIQVSVTPVRASRRRPDQSHPCCGAGQATPRSGVRGHPLHQLAHRPLTAWVDICWHESPLPSFTPTCLTGFPQAATIPPGLPISLFHSFFSSKTQPCLLIKILQNKERLLFSKPTKVVYGRKRYLFMFPKEDIFPKSNVSVFFLWGIKNSIISKSGGILFLGVAGKKVWNWILDFTGNACPVPLKLRWSGKGQSGKQSKLAGLWRMSWVDH